MDFNGYFGFDDSAKKFNDLGMLKHSLTHIHYVKLSAEDHLDNFLDKELPARLNDGFYLASVGLESLWSSFGVDFVLSNNKNSPFLAYYFTKDDGYYPKSFSFDSLADLCNVYGVKYIHKENYDKLYNSFFVI